MVQTFAWFMHGAHTLQNSLHLLKVGHSVRECEDLNYPSGHLLNAFCTLPTDGSGQNRGAYSANKAREKVQSIGETNSAWTIT